MVRAMEVVVAHVLKTQQDSCCGVVINARRRNVLAIVLDTVLATATNTYVFAHQVGRAMTVVNLIVLASQIASTAVSATQMWIHQDVKIVKQDGWVPAVTTFAAKTMVNKIQWTLASASVRLDGLVQAAIQSVLGMVKSKTTNVSATHCSAGVANFVRFRVVLGTTTWIARVMVTATLRLLHAHALPIGEVLVATLPIVQANPIALIVVRATIR